MGNATLILSRQPGRGKSQNHYTVHVPVDKLSAVLAQVRGGETVVIMDRDKPIVRLEPVTAGSSAPTPGHASGVRRGLIRPAERRLEELRQAWEEVVSGGGRGEGRLRAGSHAVITGR